MFIEKLGVNNRRKRGIMPAVFVETAVFVDRDLYKHMTTNFPKDTERELVRFVLAMINAVQLIYHDPSLGRPVNFILKRLEILHEDPANLKRPHDIDRFLSNFCTWQRLENPPGDNDPLHWDHALILTGLDLYVVNKNGKVSSQVVGKFNFVHLVLMENGIDLFCNLYISILAIFKVFNYLTIAISWTQRKR